ncbi:MAG: Hydrolase TatD [Candidatus Magasanikbacteria bacterium]|nr:Hydrolase TatD [Candidatus Magasanikbacteria bacterium]
MLIDTHCHIHFKAYDADMDEVITRSLAASVSMITIGTQSTTSKNGVAVADANDGVWCAVGLHPNHLFSVPIDEAELPSFMTRAEDFDAAYYRTLARSSKKVVAIGECGLDYYRIPEELDPMVVKEKQERVFRQHLDLCEELSLPVVVHVRDAHEEVIRLLKEYREADKLKRGGVIHCYSGTWEQAQRYFELGFFISFTGTITFPPRKGESENAVWETIRAAPLEMIMIETDAPYLTPIPHRGKRNEPTYVKFVAEKIAELKGVTFDKVGAQTTANAEKLFGISV